MKLIHVLALCVFALVGAIQVHADGVSTDDARIIIAGDLLPAPATLMVGQLL